MKYFVRILAFLFIGFCNSSIAQDYDSVCASMPADETYYSNLCSAGFNMPSSGNLDDYVYKYEGQRYIKCYVLIYGYSWDRGKIRCEEAKTPNDNCIVCSYGSYLSIPKQECPVGQYSKADYDDDGNYAGQSCSSNCFELSNRRDRFDCTCNLFGKGNYVSSKIDKTIEISNGGSGGDFYSGEVQCENGSFTNKDISDYISDSRDDNSPISKDKLKSLASTFMGANDHHTRNYTSGSSDGSRDADKGSEKPLSSEEQKQEKDKVKIDEPPSKQNSSESIKYDEKTNTVTTTDSAGNTQSVIPSNVTKNDKGELESIKYTDPETGKDIEYKTKDDGTWDRVEHQGQGTNPNENDSGTGEGEGKPGGSSDGEGAGTSEDGKKDGKDDGDGKFVGGEFGALGNANDFDTGGALSDLNNNLDTLTDDNLGLLDRIVNNVKSYIDDLKGSLDNVSKKASALSKNPFSSSNVTNCPINFSILDQNIKIDFCQYTSQFKNLFYAIFYLVLNVYIAFGIFKLFVLILISI
ncbi:MAG: hypothetical protein MSA54_05270 [Campylobacter sp.]|uniref:hypothetical protein n=1 Tax=Campylobacter sp. TaxID=205 RepID=UPI002AA702B1|nr:hypothetical protein [Campylobacter sp.]MCI7501336.1 hypothetical protein [Campylobacter sp.]